VELRAELRKRGRRRCWKCKKVRPATSEFFYTTRGKVVGSCRKCQSRASSKRAARLAKRKRIRTPARKVCADCRKRKPAHCFHRDRRLVGGLAAYCRPCQAKHSKQTRSLCRRDYARGRRQKPSSKKCPDCRRRLPASKFYEKNVDPSGLSSYCKKCEYAHHRVWAGKNRDRVAEYHHGHYVENLNWVQRRNNRWRRENPEKVLAVQHRHRSRKRQAPGHFTAADIARIRLRQGGRCYYCGRRRKLTIDHKKSLAMGGSNWPRNLALACASCNGAKGARSVAEFFRVRSRMAARSSRSSRS